MSDVLEIDMINHVKVFIFAGAHSCPRLQRYSHHRLIRLLLQAETCEPVAVQATCVAHALLQDYAKLGNRDTECLYEALVLFASLKFLDFHGHATFRASDFSVKVYTQIGEFCGALGNLANGTTSLMRQQRYLKESKAELKEDKEELKDEVARLKAEVAALRAIENGPANKKRTIRY